jgi:hypothetical protein
VPVVATDDLTQRVRAAHADAWELEGRLREPFGGGVARVSGARLMASGIAQAKWNNADVTDASVDVAAIRRWYESRGVPWGMRVPLEIELHFGEPLFVKRCVALLPGALPNTRRISVSVRRERVASAYAALEAAAFGYDTSAARAWVQPQFAHPGFRHWVAAIDEAPAAIGTTVRTDGDAGPASYLTGLALLPDAPIEALRTLVDTAATEAFVSGAAFVHTNPTTAEEDEIFAFHNPVEVAGFLIRLGRA